MYQESLRLYKHTIKLKKQVTRVWMPTYYKSTLCKGATQPHLIQHSSQKCCLSFTPISDLHNLYNLTIIFSPQTFFTWQPFRGGTMLRTSFGSRLFENDEMREINGSLLPDFFVRPNFSLVTNKNGRECGNHMRLNFSHEKKRPITLAALASGG